MIIRTWAAKHGVPFAAVLELEAMLGQSVDIVRAAPPSDLEPGSESRQSSLIRLDAAQQDIMLFRNNVGAFQAPNSKRWVRYGLANESARQNEEIKSADLIGWRSVLIMPWHVGRKLALFVSREAKEEGWECDPNDEHTAAQIVWRDLVLAYGGDAAFATGAGSFQPL